MRADEQNFNSRWKPIVSILYPYFSFVWFFRLSAQTLELFFIRSDKCQLGAVLIKTQPLPPGRRELTGQFTGRRRLGAEVDFPAGVPDGPAPGQIKDDRALGVDAVF